MALRYAKFVVRSALLSRSIARPSRHVRCLSSPSSPSAQSAQLGEAFFKPRLVIFDKDGTLVCFHTMWMPWCHSLAQRMRRASGRHDLTEDLYDVLGYDHEEKKVRIGALAENTHPQIRDMIEEMLTERVGFTKGEAETVVNECWLDTPETLEIKTTTPDLGGLFDSLKREGVKIAVCTSDSREGTTEFLRRERLTPFVDRVVCGDDADGRPKPDPHNALLICRELGVTPSHTIMVGDTPADTLMGQQAGMGLTVGVLSGVGGVEDLADADVIVSDVQECVEMILPHDEGSQGPGGSPLRSRVHQVTARGLAKIARAGPMWGSTQRQQQMGRRGFATSATQRQKSYSHIIVGAGSAGCVLTNRLTEDSSAKVLLLEAGPKDTIMGSTMLQWKIRMPAALMYNLCDDKYNWFYHTVPQKHCNDRVMYWPRGRVWGGSSALNAMVYIRGHAGDFDRWARQGAAGWDYAGCLPYFRRAQHHQRGGDDYRGGEGPLHVSMRNWDNPLHSVFLEAGKQAGHPFSEDVNGFQQEGVSWFDMTIKDGQRWSAASAYLRPALEQRGDRIETKERVLVTKVIMDGKKAVGVEYVDADGSAQKAFADKVILSGGAINSPQLLMLSGIGPAQNLREAGVDVVHDLPGVGQNLQDHLELYVVQACSQPISLLKDQKGMRMIRVGVEWFMKQTGPARTAHLESGGFCRSRPGVEHPDIMFHFLPSQVIDHGRKAAEVEAYQVHVGPMRPTSRGSIKLKSNNPREHPIIDPNYLSTEIDRWEMRESVRLARDIFAQPAFAPYRAGELEPGPDCSDSAALDAFARAKADSAYHPSCTCAMGSDGSDATVVDSGTMGVVGLENLYVVDASVMPSVSSGNLNAPTIMLAERAADIIRGIPLLPRSEAPVYKPPKLDNSHLANLEAGKEPPPPATSPSM